MKSRRQIIQFMPALPLVGAASALGLLSACGDKAPPPAAVVVPVSPPAVVAAPAPAPAPAPAVAATGAMPLVDPADPQAVALGYVSDATTVDKAKSPKYEAGQLCSNCALYQGAAAEQGPCPLFPGKNVAAKAWCNSYVKKA